MLRFLLKYPLETFSEGRLTFLSRLRIELVVLLAVAAGLVAWWLYRRVAPKLGRTARWTVVTLRVLVAALVVFLLALPVLEVARPRRSTVSTAVLVDVSRSMTIADADARGKTRFDAARELLVGSGASPGLLASLGDDATVVLYAFDREARRVTDPQQFRTDGQFTNLFRSIRDVEEDLRGLAVSSVVMLSDGCRNDGGSAAEAAAILKGRGIPLHVVGIGNPQPPKDYEVSRVFAPSRVRRNSEVDVYANVRYTGYRQPFDVSIYREKTRLATQRIIPQAGSDMDRVRLTFTPDFEGSATYRVEIPVDAEETLQENNAAQFTMDMQDDRLAVLYVEGSPRLEYRFLRRSLFRDKDFRLVGMLRLSNRPQDAGVKSGGKLGFYVQGANLSESFLEKGFPTTPEQLFAFQAIILGDIEASFFTPAQLDLIEQFARVRGGGVLMLGGVNSFGLGKYAGTPVEKLLPVAISRNDPPYSDETFQARTTPDSLAAGSPHLLMRLSTDEDVNRRLWASAPPLIGITPAGALKAGAVSLLVHEKTNLPVLAVQNYGQGRTAAFTSGGSWYWRVSLPAKEEFHERFWKQMVRWLVVGVKERVAVETTAGIYARAQEVTIRATVLGRDLQPVNDAKVIATLTDPLGNSQDLAMDWVLSEDGVYQCQVIPNDEGDYRVKVAVESRSGVAAGEDWKAVKPVETEFRVSEPLVEFNNAGLQEELLKNMAAITDGKYYSYGQTQDLVENVRQSIVAARDAGVDRQQAPLWDMPVLLGLILVMLAVEWTVRRRAGLA